MTSMGVDDVLHDGKPEPRSANGTLAAIDAPEFFEYLFQSRFGNPPARVGNRHLDDARIRAMPCGDPNSASLRGEFQGVAQQVLEHHIDLLGVHPQRRQILRDLHLQINFLSLGDGREPLQVLFHDRRQAGFLKGERHHSRFHHGEIEEPVDGSDQTLALVQDECLEFPFPLRHCGEDTLLKHARRLLDGCQRCAQFVGKMTDVIDLHLVQFPEPVAHGIEGYG